MNYKTMGRFISQILMLEALFMLPAVIIGLGFSELHAVRSFLLSIGALLLVAAVLWAFGRGAGKGFYAKEGLVCVGLSWIVMSMLGCLPFYL